MEEHSDQNSSNSNELPNEFISNPNDARGNLEDIISPDINWLKALESNNFKNTPHSPMAQHQIMHYIHSLQPSTDETSNQSIQLIEEQGHKIFDILLRKLKASQMIKQGLKLRIKIFY